jgi:hypothetical protein
LAARRGGGFSFTIVEDTLTPGLAGVMPKIDRLIATTMKMYEPQVENYARANAPWTDQTSNARNGLIATSGQEGSNHFIDLAHRVSYGIYLETRWGARYAIINPTIQAMGPRVMGTLQGILTKVG